MRVGLEDSCVLTFLLEDSCRLTFLQFPEETWNISENQIMPHLSSKEPQGVNAYLQPHSSLTPASLPVIYLPHSQTSSYSPDQTLSHSCVKATSSVPLPKP